MSFHLTYRHQLILLSTQNVRNKSEIQKEIYIRMGEDLSMGRHILPYTKQLIKWGLIARVNPGEPDVKGHKLLITDAGTLEVQKYIERLNSFNKPSPDFVF